LIPSRAKKLNGYFAKKTEDRLTVGLDLSTLLTVYVLDPDPSAFLHCSADMRICSVLSRLD
jgi:hypothetical protein